MCPDCRLDLLGLGWVEQLGLLDLPIRAICDHVQLTVEITHDFSELFQPGPGLCNHAQAILHLRPDTQAAFRPERPVPYAALALVNAELERSEHEGIVGPVSLANWEAPIVLVKKPNGIIRVYADCSTGLNAALGPHGYPLPPPDDIFTRLNGSTLDLADAY